MVTEVDNAIFVPIPATNGKAGFKASPNAFWKDKYSDWEPGTQTLLQAFLFPKDLYVDVGAWIGPTVLHAAALGATVETFEPDPIAREELLCNLALNVELASRVTVFPWALSTFEGEANLSARGHLGNSCSTLIAGENSKGVPVEVKDARELFETRSYHKAKLIKIDIEGAEYDLIPHLKDFFAKHKPLLYLSLHPFIFQREKHSTLKQLRAFTAVLDSLSGYGECYEVTPSALNAVGIEGALQIGGPLTSLLFSDRRLI